MKRRLIIAGMLMLLQPTLGVATREAQAASALHVCGTSCPPVPPTGIYVLNEAANEQSTAAAYASGLTTSEGYNDVEGHAIFVPIAKLITTPITTWGQFVWDWNYVDTLVGIALANGKKFSIELETGFQSSTTYLQSLPPGFAATCNAGGPECAPLFHVWTVGGATDTCIDAYVLLPWVPNVQEFWKAAARALAAHLRDIGAARSLTLVHIPGLSVYDEELRLPTGIPQPPSKSTATCPDPVTPPVPAYPTVINDASAARWQSLGYSDDDVLHGFRRIARAFARAFPHKYLGLSLFNPGGNDFPNLPGAPEANVAERIVKEVTALAPGRVQLQADILDIGVILPQVTEWAATYSTTVGWQTNKHAGTGAGCNDGHAGSCDPDGPDSPYFQLLQYGAANQGEYVEVWSADVVRYGQSLDAAKAAGLYDPPATATAAVRAGGPCNHFSGEAVNDDTGAPFSGTACREADGRWHIVDGE